MQLGRFRLASELAEPLAQQLLLIDGDLLVAEEDNTSLGDCKKRKKTFKFSGTLTVRTENTEISNEFIGIRCFEQLRKLSTMRELSTNERRGVDLGEVVERVSEFQWSRGAGELESGELLFDALCLRRDELRLGWCWGRHSEVRLLQCRKRGRVVC